ncbi:hypothetical protein [Nonomuraea sp. NPDC003201]
MRARAAVLRDPGGPFAVEDVSLAAPGPGEALVRVAPGDHVVMSYDSCGWCGRCVTGAASYCDEFVTPLPRSP